MTGSTGSSGGGQVQLAAFSHDWVGGDIAGLAAFAGTLAGYVPRIGVVVTALDKQVAGIVNAGGWQGRAAGAFSQAWQADAVGATALGTVITSAAEISGWLASRLSVIENALEEAAQQTAAHGVQIGPDGQPAPEPLTATAASWRTAYLSFWNECMADATRARITATGELQALYAKIAPPAGGGGGDGGLQPGDYNTLADYLRGFWALPTEYRKEVQESVEAQEASVKAATKALAADRDALGRFTKGNKVNAHLDGLKDAQSKLSGLEDELASAQGNEELVTKGLDFSVADIPAFSGKDLSGLLKAAADTPFVDIASAGFGTYLSAEQDIRQGVNPVVAITGETAGSVASLGGASAVASELAGPLAVRLGVAGVTAWGIGDFVHNAIDEPWGADMSQVSEVNIGPGISMPNPFEALDGIVTGTGNVIVRTGGDAVNLAVNTATQTWQAVDGTWHSLDDTYHAALNVFNPTSWVP